MELHSLPVHEVKKTQDSSPVDMEMDLALPIHVIHQTWVDVMNLKFLQNQKLLQSAK